MHYGLNASFDFCAYRGLQSFDFCALWVHAILCNSCAHRVAHTFWAALQVLKPWKEAQKVWATLSRGFKFFDFCALTLFLSGSGMTLSVRAGPLWPRMDFSHPEAVSRHSKAQKWLPSNFFDLCLSIDTKNSTLWVVVLANPAVKRPWWKMKIFMQKYVKI